jgi:hypothetical protein
MTIASIALLLTARSRHGNQGLKTPDTNLLSLAFAAYTDNLLNDAAGRA